MAEKHHAPKDVSYKIALGFTKALRFIADTFFKKKYEDLCMRGDMKPNTEFELSVCDIDMIEHALRDRQRKVSSYRLEIAQIEIKSKEELRKAELADQELHEISDLLARLHDQKIWYRPKKVYISG